MMHLVIRDEVKLNEFTITAEHKPIRAIKPSKTDSGTFNSVNRDGLFMLGKKKGDCS